MSNTNPNNAEIREYKNLLVKDFQNILYFKNILKKIIDLGLLFFLLRII